MAPFLNCSQWVLSQHDDVDVTPLEDFEEHLPSESEDHDASFVSVALHPPRTHQHVASPCLRIDKKDQDQAG